MVLDTVNFPFIIQLSRTFRDNHDLYHLVEFVKGVELFDVIRDIGEPKILFLKKLIK